MFNYKVFISYRGASEDKNFASRLFDYLKKDPLCDKRYGDIYFSPKTKSVEINFKEDVPKIMGTVEYFVMPLTENYYSDFWDDENNCPNEDSITFQEIKFAIANKCRFIGISFPGFSIDSKLIRKLFGEYADTLLCLEPLAYHSENEEAIFKTISNVLRQKEQNHQSVAQIISKLSPNIYLSFKGETEDKTKYPLYEKLRDVQKITLLNFASSSFIAGIDVASIYQESDLLKAWFDKNLIEGNIEANIILTNPHSYAAYDAAAYKMYPSGLNMDKKDIILRNMNKLFSFIRKNPNARLNVYLTDIILPYGVMITEHNNPINNHIKIDLYSPVISDDKMRPSFYMLQNNPDTAMLYSFFEGNVKNIMNNFSFRFKGHPDTNWLLEKHIIHRGVINRNVLPHTRKAFDECIDARYPIEADLLLLSDGTIIIGRKDEKITLNGEIKELGECTRKDLRIYNKAAGDNRIFTLDHFLEYINAKVPVLLEIKNDHCDGKSALSKEKSKEYVKDILAIVQKHFQYTSAQIDRKQGVVSHKLAFHSADPYILQCIKEIDCMIPCGIISMDFAKVKDVVGEEFSELHSKRSYLDMFEPDFICYNVQDLKDQSIKRLCKQYNIPLLGWTVTDEDVQQRAEDYGCDNIITEGRKTYLD